jgi:hypothetical protein
VSGSRTELRRSDSDSRIDANGNLLLGKVQVDDGAVVVGSILENVEIGSGARVFQTRIRGEKDRPVVVGNDVELFCCDISTRGGTLDQSFSFGPFATGATPTRIGVGAQLGHSLIVNSDIGSGTKGSHTTVRCSRVGENNNLRSFSQVILSSTGRACNIGCEVSKTFLGEGFTSEHASSYLSLAAPSAFPVIDKSGREQVIELPNVTNIGAGTVFANYGGEPIPAKTLEESPGSLKGTALVFSAFTAINSRVVNRYGSPSDKATVMELYWHPDLTILGLASFVENKATGRVPAFAYAGSSDSAGARGQRLGWVLEHKPGIVLAMVKKMRGLMGKDVGSLPELVEGTIRLEIEVLDAEARKKGRSPYSEDQLHAGIEILKENLDGRWTMNESGHWLHSWTGSDLEWR